MSESLASLITNLRECADTTVREEWVKDLYRSAAAELSRLQADKERLEGELRDMTDDYMRRHKDVGDMMERALSAEQRIKALEKALREISKGEGRFSRDPLEHASNTIEDMKALAIEAIQSPR